MRNFEKHIKRLFSIMNDCAVYKIRMGSNLRPGEGCDRKCKECQQTSMAWLLAEEEV